MRWDTKPDNRIRRTLHIQHRASWWWLIRDGWPFLGGVMTSVRERLRMGQVPLAGFVNLIPSPVVTQALAVAGAEVVVVDLVGGDR
jgi:hypothetical protein